jgi:beta-galactosidase
LLLVNTDLAARTWFSNQALILGPTYVTENLSAEFPAAGGTGTAYTATGKKTISAGATTVVAPAAFGNWKMKSAVDEAAAGYADTTWLSSTGDPKPMSANGDFQNGYGWYRTTFSVATAQTMTLSFGGVADKALAYVNGAPVAATWPNLTVQAKAGQNTLAILTTQTGRPSLYNVTGATGTTLYKGLWGTTLNAVASASLTSFKMSINNASNTQAATYASPTFDDSAWTTVAPAANNMNGTLGYAWFRAKFNMAASANDVVVNLRGVDDEGWVYLNGTLVGYHKGWQTGEAFHVTGIAKTGTNVIAVCVNNSSYGGGLTQPVDVLFGTAFPQTWKFRGGIGGLDETALLGQVKNWTTFLGSTWQSGTTASAPTFFRADFANPRSTTAWQTVGLRTTGLSAGSVWINGHNLGFYSGAELLYVPEAWLSATNTIVIYDELGKAPTSAKLEFYETHTVNSTLKTSTPVRVGLAASDHIALEMFQGPSENGNTANAAPEVGCSIGAHERTPWGALVVVLGLVLGAFRGRSRRAAPPSGN